MPGLAEKISGAISVLTESSRFISLMIFKEFQASSVSTKVDNTLMGIAVRLI